MADTPDSPLDDWRDSVQVPRGAAARLLDEVSWQARKLLWVLLQREVQPGNVAMVNVAKLTRDGLLTGRAGYRALAELEAADVLRLRAGSWPREYDVNPHVIWYGPDELRQWAVDEWDRQVARRPLRSLTLSTTP